MLDQKTYRTQFGDNWDGYGSPAPKRDMVAHAYSLVAGLQTITVAEHCLWANPHMGANERGQVTLEWWQGERTLTLFVRSENHVDYLLAWGSKIQEEMEDGELKLPGDFVNLLQSLYEATRSDSRQIRG